jgi:hypothetical protein
MIHRSTVPAGIHGRRIEDHHHWRFRLTNTNGVWQIAHTAPQ